MTDLEAILLIERESAVPPELELVAWSTIIRTGIYRQLQGFYGRAAAKLIEDGVLDASGSILRIPGRETDMTTMKTLKILTEDEFINTYGPEANDDSSFYRWREWCTPEERNELADHAEERKAWTYVDTDHGGALYNGVHIVNRIGYVFTQIPYEEGEEIMVPFDNHEEEDLDEAERESDIADAEDSEGSTAQTPPDVEKR